MCDGTEKIEKRHIMKKLIWMSSYNIPIYVCIQADLLSDRREIFYSKFNQKFAYSPHLIGWKDGDEIEMI